MRWPYSGSRHSGRMVSTLTASPAVASTNAAAPHATAVRARRRRERPRGRIPAGPGRGAIPRSWARARAPAIIDQPRSSRHTPCAVAPSKQPSRIRRQFPGATRTLSRQIGSSGPDLRATSNNESAMLVWSDSQAPFEPEPAMLRRPSAPPRAALDVERLEDRVNPVSFETTGFGTGSNVLSVALGDFNGDGHPDIVAGTGGNEVEVHINDGAGAYTPGANVPIGAPFDVHVADINGDGKLDIFVANSFGQRLVVSLGNGDGTFEMPIARTCRTTPTARLRPISTATGTSTSSSPIRWALRCSSTTVRRILRPHGLLPPHDLPRFSRRCHRRLQRGRHARLRAHRIPWAAARRLSEQRQRTFATPVPYANLVPAGSPEASWPRTSLATAISTSW